MTRSAESIVEAWSAEGRALAVEGAATRVWDRGSGEPVVCLHGVPASAFLYRKLLAELEASGLRGIAFDFPGLGLAERPESFDYSWSGLARWSAAAVDSLGLERFHLVVHDIGGPIGFDLVGRMPGRIASLTVLNTLTRVASFKRPFVMEPFARRGIGEIYLRTLTPLSFVPLMRWQGVSSAVPAAEIKAYVLLLKRGDRGRAFLRIMRGFERTPEFEQRIVAVFSERDYPAQVVWGENDPALRISPYGEDARDLLGLETIHRLPGKHFVPEDSPGAIAGLIARLASD